MRLVGEMAPPGPLEIGSGEAVRAKREAGVVCRSGQVVIAIYQLKTAGGDTCPGPVPKNRLNSEFVSSASGGA